jgi:hypothetical protein
MGRKLEQGVHDLTERLIAQGLTGQEIAAVFGIAHRTLVQRCWNWGLKITRNLHGKRNPNWRGGPLSRIIHNGYVKLYRPDHLYADCRGYVFEHRLVMEERLGRYLLKEEVVHHNDYNRQNNAIENLRLFSSQKVHIAFHIKTDPVFKPKQADEVDDLPF